MSSLGDFQSDHLFLLVGTNPLPNYVAALLQIKEGGTVYLLHTPGINGTVEIARRLKALLSRKRIDLKSVRLYEIDEANGEKIQSQFDDIFKELDISSTESVGLNYTGGTKVMAVHSYQAFAAYWAKKRGGKVAFTYLDARTLELRRDGQYSPLYVGEQPQVKVLLQDMLGLHGYQIEELRREPQYLDMVWAIVKANQTQKGIDQWRKWIQEESFQTMPTSSQYPDLSSVYELAKQWCELNPSAECIAHKMGWEKLVSVSKFFISEWLEEYVLEAVRQVSNNVSISDYGISLEPKQGNKDKFELDIAVTYGYQLFALSCIASTSSGGETKKHLFEAYVRARQIGGDEARTGLVCLVDEGGKQKLENEVQREWQSAGHIKVFGRRDLQDLPRRLEEWFRSACKGD